MTEANRDRKSVEAALAGVKRQAKDQRQHLWKVKEQFAIVKEQLETHKKQLEKAEEVAAQAKQEGYDTGVKETKENLKAQVTYVCRVYYLQVWTEALDRAGVSASSKLRKPENTFYPPALRPAGPPSIQADATIKAPKSGQAALPSVPPSSSDPSTKGDQVSSKGKEEEPAKEKVPELAKSLPTSKEPSKEKGQPKARRLYLLPSPSPPRRILRTRV